MSELFGFITGLAAVMGKSAINMFTGNFLGAFGTTNIALIGVVFVMFIFLMRKAMGIMISLAMVGIASASFPFVAGYLGFSIPTTPQTIVFFVVMGVAAYAAFMIGKYVLKLLGFFTKPAQPQTK
ncbi:MAG: hypothetical protein HY831_00835 [Candidatus Aenigmarchaeota archaeon]|nr:hypothetical protein [Candidatus Aenigmarchaeota archaeon]